MPTSRRRSPGPADPQVAPRGDLPHLNISEGPSPAVAGPRAVRLQRPASCGPRSITGGPVPADRGRRRERPGPGGAAAPGPVPTNGLGASVVVGAVFVGVSSPMVVRPPPAMSRDGPGRRPAAPTCSPGASRRSPRWCGQRPARRSRSRPTTQRRAHRPRPRPRRAPDHHAGAIAARRAVDAEQVCSTVVRVFEGEPAGPVDRRAGRGAVSTAGRRRTYQVEAEMEAGSGRRRTPWGQVSTVRTSRSPRCRGRSAPGNARRTLPGPPGPRRHLRHRRRPSPR